MRYLIVALVLVGCQAEEAKRPPYPGQQFSYQECHNVYDLGYKLDVAKCERDIENPKFKRGQTVRFVKSSKYHSSCKATIINGYRWMPSPVDELVYAAKVYCSGKPAHDEWCEKGNTLNCPEFKESELK